MLPSSKRTRVVRASRVAQGGPMRTLRLFTIFSIFSWSLLLAQIDRANLNGTVTDVSGAVVPGATVEVVSQQTGLKRQGVTGSYGTFTITGLPIGTYDLTVARAGFQTNNVPAIELL